MAKDVNLKKKDEILTSGIKRYQGNLIAKMAAGNHVRMADGRCGDGFVDTSVLYQLEKDGVVEFFTHKGVTFARLLSEMESVK